MLVLIGKSKLLLARLASQVRRASEVGWLSDSLFVLSRGGGEHSATPGTFFVSGSSNKK